MAEKKAPLEGKKTETAKKATPKMPEVLKKYEELDAVTNTPKSKADGDLTKTYEMMPEAPWPPPIYVRKNIPNEERYYMEHRWYSQWAYFDKRASESKRRYQYLQLVIGVGSVIVPVLVGIQGLTEEARNILYLGTVTISLGVAIATALENVFKHGDNWRSYRQAAEDMKQEKSLYDVKAGRYADNPKPFMRFVERCEEIMAQQNGRWIQSTEQQQLQSEEESQEFIDALAGDEAEAAVSTEGVG